MIIQEEKQHLESFLSSKSSTLYFKNPEDAQTIENLAIKRDDIWSML